MPAAHRSRCRAGRGDAGVSRLVWVLAVAVLLAGAVYGAYSRGYLDDTLCDRGIDAARCPADAVPPPDDLDLPPARGVRPVLGRTGDQRLRSGAVRDAVRPLLRAKALGKHVGFAVRDLAADRDVYSSGQGSFTPASTLKLFTALAALAAINPEHRFETTVTGRTTGGTTRLVLVGGGDPFLASTRASAAEGDYPRPATLTDLAARTAMALRADGARRQPVRLAYDDSLFTGPAVSPHWEPGYVSTNVATPVSALWADEGVVSTGPTLGSRTPAKDAATAFATALERRGVQVRGPVHRVSSGVSGQEVATVAGPTLAQVVESLLERSDNQAAEIVLRQVALAEGEPASFDGGTRAVRSVLTGLGVPWAGNRIHDGSGLARDDAVTPDALLAVLAAADRRQALRTVVSGLPAAGFNGTLASRFTAPSSAGGLGYVRAKTGTLSGVHALAGTTVDADGTPLAFVVVADRVRLRQTLAARATLDRIAAALTTCACRR